MTHSTHIFFHESWEFFLSCITEVLYMRSVNSDTLPLLLPESCSSIHIYIIEAYNQGAKIPNIQPT